MFGGGGAGVKGAVVFSVGLVGGEQGSIHGLHAGGAGEGPHQPVVYTVHVVDVHTGQEPDGVAVHEVQHADHTPAEHKQRQSAFYSKSEANMTTS